jgi:hypothetical protein
MAVTKKLAEVLMMETRVVDEARVRAAVNRVHMARLKRRFRPKKIARMRYSTISLSGESERACAMARDHDVVRAVVVLDVQLAHVSCAECFQGETEELTALQIRH